MFALRASWLHSQSAAALEALACSLFELSGCIRSQSPRWRRWRVRSSSFLAAFAVSRRAGGAGVFALRASWLHSQSVAALEALAFTLRASCLHSQSGAALEALAGSLFERLRVPSARTPQGHQSSIPPLVFFRDRRFREWAVVLCWGLQPEPSSPGLAGSAKG